MAQLSVVTVVREDKSSCTWKIRNWHSTANWSQDMSLESLDFRSNTSQGLKWLLKVFPMKGEFALCFVSKSPASVRAKATLCVLKGKKEIVSSQEMGPTKFSTTWNLMEDIKEWHSPVCRSDLEMIDGTESADSITIMCEVTEFRYPNECQLFSVTDCEVLNNCNVLFTTREWSDVIILAKGKVEIKAHKLFLVACSPVFAAMFRTAMEEEQTNYIKIEDTDPNIIEEMLRFIYTGKVDDIDEFAMDLLIVADKYQLKRLKLMCEEKVHATLNVENASHIFITADRYNCEQLKALTKDFISKHAGEVMKTEGCISMIKTNCQLLKEI